ncbi:MAG: hypothetical protein M3362_27075, partial [Acidobacteriota bacterium]|nr:hypothetical protein [Acidobacteriota bacterium]
YLASVILLALSLVSSCSFTTAHISSLKLSKDKEGNTEATSFAPRDTIYAKATVSNVPSKVTVKFRFITEKVEGQPENAAVEQFDKSYDLPSDGFATYYLSPPNAGWPPGKYRIEASMFTESGEQKDQKSAAFTVSGD